MKITLLLPLPPKELSPNARNRWARINMTKQYRTAAHLAGTVFRYQDDWISPIYYGVGRYRLTEIYRIAGKRQHDVRNLFAAFKAGEDGLVDAGLLPGDDDSVLEHGAPRIERVKTKAEEGVLVEIEEIA